MLAILLALAACGSGTPDAAPAAVVEQQVEKLVVVANGEVVGTLSATVDGSRVRVEYDVDDNGRGPSLDEVIELDPRGYPVRWRVDGTSLFGAAVEERFDRDGEVLRWVSQADQGALPAGEAELYVANDASPWALGLYARALLATSERALPVAPSGRMFIEELDRLTVGEPAVPLTVYALRGLSLTPQLVVLDAAGRLFALPGGRGMTIRAGYQPVVPMLQEHARRLQGRRMRELQARLAHRYEVPLRIDDVRVFDPATGTLSEPVSVRVDAGRISAIEAPLGDAGAPDEVVVDGAGGTLLPGLHDLHAHNALQTGLFYLAAGVTSVRDMGNDNALLDELVAGIDAGELPGPRITRAGLIEARSPYSARIGIVAGTLEEALEAVDWYAARGYRAIKTYNSMAPEWVAPLVARARAHDLRVTGHVPAFMTADDVIDAGYDSIAHINQLMLGWLLTPAEDTRTALRLTGLKRAAGLDLDSEPVQRTLAAMAANGVAQDTTAVIVERLMLSRQGATPPGDEAYLSHMPIGYQRYRKRTFVPLPEPGDDAAYRAAFDVILQTIGALHERGIQLLPGTDDDTGVTVHRELELYARAGIGNADVLRLATLEAARYLGTAERVGSIEPGKAADFILLPGDPLRDISAVRQIRLVARGGVVYFPSEIYTALAIEPFAAPPRIRLPAPAD